MPWRWVDLSLRTKSLTVIAIPVVPLLVSAALFAANARRAGAAQDSVAHTLEVKGQIATVLGYIHDAETGVRGFLLTRSDESLRVYQNAVASLAPATRRLVQILYVEDNVSNVRLMERIFKRRPGVTLLHAPRGSVGLAMAREHRPAAIFLDLHLPDMSGEEVLRQLWEDPALRSIPVAVLSADATAGQMRRLKASGAAAYLTKPLDITQVVALADEFLER